MYRLQQEVPHNYITGSTQKNTCFARRWKDIAMSESLDSLLEYAIRCNVEGLQIIDHNLSVKWRA